MRLQTRKLKDGRTKVTAYEGRNSVGMLSFHRRYTQGHEVAQVLQSNVLRPLLRQGIGTKLYEAAAEAACEQGLQLASSPKWMRSAHSSGFWDKQLRKGRAKDIGDGVIVLDQSCGADLSGMPGCTVEEQDTGTENSLRFDAFCKGAEAGSIRVHKARSKIKGKTVWTVDNVNVGYSFRRQGVATKLYEAAAQAVCRRRGSLASIERDYGAHSMDFWLKQEAKGRARRVPRPREYSKTGRDHYGAADMYDAFILDCAEASDLSGIDMTRNQKIGLGVGVGALVLFALTRKKMKYSDWLVPTVTKISAPPSDIRTALGDASRKYGVPVSILIGVAHTESRYNPRAGSNKGAQGLMQLMPKTAASLGVQDPWDAQQSAYGGAKLLAALYKQYGTWVQAIAAYNWGQGNLNNNPEPWQWPQATRTYVANVLKVSDTV